MSNLTSPLLIPPDCKWLLLPAHCTLMSHTDRSAALLQVEHTVIVLGEGPCPVARLPSLSPDLASPPKNPDHENGEKLFNGLTPQLSTT